MANDTEIKSDYDEIFDVSRNGWDRFQQQGMLNLDFYLRAQHTHEEAEKAESQGRELYTLDKVGRQVNLLHGYEIKNRHILKIGPQGKINLEEDKACSQHTSLIMNQMTMRGGYEVLSQAFKWGTLVQGSNLIEIWRDRRGDIQFSRLGWNQFLLNPGLTKVDLSDCGDILIGRWVDEKRVKTLLPANSDDIDKIGSMTNVSRWQFLRDPLLQNRTNRMLFEEWWRRETDFEDMVISRVSGQEITLKAFADRFTNGDMRAAKRSVKEAKLQNGAPALARITVPKDKIRLSVFVNNKLKFDGSNPLRLNEYNHIWVHGDWCAECPRDDIKLQGYVSRLRDPQRALNRRTNQIYDIIESQIQAVRVVRSRKLLNPEDAHKSGQGIVLHLNEDAGDELSLDQVFQQFPASQVGQDLFAALEMTDKAETDVGGLNQEIFGSDDKDIPAILSKHRTGQALTGQAGMFQGFRGSKAQMGRKLARVNQLNTPPQKVAEIINEQPVQGFYKENLTRYDCSPVEGLLTDSQQELFFIHLMNIRSAFPKEAHKIPLSEVAKYSPTPFRPELIQIIQKSEQKEAQAMAQAQKTQQIQEMLNVELAKGQVVANRGIAAAQQAKAVEDQSDAALNRVKTIAEINDLGQARVLELAGLGLQFEQLAQQNREVSAKS